MKHSMGKHERTMAIFMYRGDPSPLLAFKVELVDQWRLLELGRESRKASHWEEYCSPMMHGRIVIF